MRTKANVLLCTLLLCVLLAGCSEQRKIDNTPKDCEEIAAAILSSQSFTEEMTQVNDKRMKKALALEEGSYLQVYMAIDASRATSETIIVVTAANDSALVKVEKALKDYRDATLEQYRTYQPLEIPKLEAAEIIKHGTQCVLVIAPDQHKVSESCRQVWNQ